MYLLPLKSDADFTQFIEFQHYALCWGCTDILAYIAVPIFSKNVTQEDSDIDYTAAAFLCRHNLA